MSSQGRIRVLIVDDSAIVRKVLSDILSAEPDFEVVGTAPDPYVARDKILALEPDVLTLDIEMPRMDGLTFLGRIMQYRPMPVVVISSVGHSANALEALSRGAVEVLLKPGGPYSVGDLRHDLPRRLRAAAASKRRRVATAEATPVSAAPVAAAAQVAKLASAVAHPVRVEPAAGGHSDIDLIAIGASTGGVTAIETVVRHLPADMPGIVITQHIPAGFSTSFANRLNQLCALRVKEAADGDRVERGLVLVAPGNLHMSVERSGGIYRAVVRDGPRVCFQRPSVDVLFNSVAAAGKRALGVILTGMGNDGAAGLKAMRDKGAITIGQDEASCVVYGMPREAAQMGAVQHVLPLEQIAQAILSHTFKGGRDKTSAPAGTTTVEQR